MKNDVWEVVPRPEGRSVVGSRWIYKIKYIAYGSVEKYKARFVAKGYAQKEGVDYEETFTLVARYTSIRFVVSLAAQMGWDLHPCSQIHLHQICCIPSSSEGMGDSPN